LRSATIEARNRAEAAAKAFDEHVETHCCDTTGPSEPKVKAANAA
jgi:hypothetical protein